MPERSSKPVRHPRPKLAADFRRVALSMPEAQEGAHMGHADFRAGGKIFATLNHDETLGVVMLTPEEQKEFIEAEPAVFFPVKGGWGDGGATHVRLATAEEEALGQAITAAWRRVTAKKAAARAPRKGRSPRLQ
jgi:hypothetical protein